MNTLLALILAFLVGEFLLESITDLLNAKSFRPAPSPEVAREFEGYYDPEKYSKSRDYQWTHARFGIIQGFVGTVLVVGFILAGGFNLVDQWARGFGLGTIGTGLIFAGALSVLKTVVSMPFALYRTFVIEERFGFNRTTLKTFVGDLVKGTILGVLIGAPIFAGLLYFFEQLGEPAWFYAWFFVTVVQLFLAYIAPVVIMPIFNKFTPLPEGELKSRIEEYAKKQNFGISGIFTMDGSKRSSKANAFFTGFGGLRRLVFFDTLLQKHSVDEIVAVLAHEIGHYQRKHIPKSLTLSILVTGAMFYFLGVMMNNEALFEAFGMEQVSVYASIVFVSFLYSPVLRLLSLATNGLSRKFEYEADAFAVQTYGKPEDLVTALKKLSSDSLSHLTPHRLKVLFDYSHPPVIERVRAIRSGKLPWIHDPLASGVPGGQFLGKDN